MEASSEKWQIQVDSVSLSIEASSTRDSIEVDLNSVSDSDVMHVSAAHVSRGREQTEKYVIFQRKCPSSKYRTEVSAHRSSVGFRILAPPDRDASRDFRDVRMRSEASVAESEGLA